MVSHFELLFHAARFFATDPFDMMLSENVLSYVKTFQEKLVAVYPDKFNAKCR